MKPSWLACSSSWGPEGACDEGGHLPPAGRPGEGAAGAATFEDSVRCPGKAGRLVVCGATTGALVQLDLRTLWRKQINIHGSAMANDREFRTVMGLLVAGKLHPVVDRVFSLREAQAAEIYLESTSQFGKVVLEV